MKKADPRLGVAGLLTGFLLLTCVPSLLGQVELVQQTDLPDDLNVEAMHLTEAQTLSLEEVTKLSVQRNLEMMKARLDQASSSKNISIAKSIYDTRLGSNATYTQDNQERASVVLGDRQIDSRVDFSLQKKIPLGTVLGVEAGTSRSSSNSSFSSLNKYYSSDLTFYVEQSLARNFFGYVDRKQIEQVRLDIEKFDYETLDRIENTLAEVRRQYWELIWASENLRIRREDLRTAQDFLQLTQDKLELGLTEKPDLYAAEANVRQRVIGVLEAQNLLQNQSFVLKVLLNTPEVDLILPSHKIEFTPRPIEFEAELDTAFENRRDLKQAELELKRQGIEVKIKKNQRLPDLTFEGRHSSISLDKGMASSQGEVFAYHHLKYYAGFSFSWNIENRKERAEQQQAEFQLSKVKKEMEELKLMIMREVDESLRNVLLAESRVSQTREIEVLQQMKLEEELRSFNLGRSDAKTIIDYQEDLIAAESGAMRALVDHAVALDQMHRSTHRLLEKTGIAEAEALQGEGFEGQQKP